VSLRRRHSKALKLVGQQFGRLLVLARAENNKHRQTRWLCRCQCGVETIVAASQLRTGRSRSCGCLRRELNTTHGMTHTRAYRSYYGAKTRCHNRMHGAYRYYGGRGIEFRYKSFEQFIAELGERPPGMTIERIDRDGHYEPGNVRWASRKEQSANLRSTRLLTLTLPLSQWSAIFDVPRETLRHRLNKGATLLAALTTSVRQNGRRAA
jgi:hypothetical protein